MSEYSKLSGQLDDQGEAEAPAREEVATVTFKLPKSTLDRLNNRARELGVTRSFLIRRGITEVLAGGSHSRISKLVLVSTFETFDDNGAPVEHSNVIRDDGENPRLARLVTELAAEADSLNES